jgi:hypothetical protein
MEIVATICAFYALVTILLNIVKILKSDETIGQKTHQIIMHCAKKLLVHVVIHHCVAFFTVIVSIWLL